MDGRKNNGGARVGAGRPAKADEAKLIERLDNIIDSDDVIKELLSLVKEGDFRAIQLYMNYRWGKPSEKMDITTNGSDLNIPVISFRKSDDRD